MVSSGGIVIIQKFADYLRSVCIDRFRECTDIPPRFSSELSRVLFADFVESLHALLIEDRIAESLSARASHVIHADGCDDPDPMANLRRADGVTGTAANAKHADTVLIHERVIAQKIHCRAEILDACGRNFYVARLPAALSVM